MKRILTQLLIVTVLTTVAFGAQARNNGFGDLVDLGELALDTDYLVKGDFNDYIGTFVAPTSGTLVATSTDTYTLFPYREKLDDMETPGNAIDYVLDNPYGSKQYHFDVVEGTTYYFYIGFSMSTFTFRMTMDAGDGIALTKTTPEEGSVLSISDGGLISLQFNRAVNLDPTAQIIAGNSIATATINGQNNMYSLEIKEPLFNWLQDGTLKGGDKIKVRINNVTAAEDASVVYGTDGTLEIEYIVGDMPITLQSTENTSGTFKSYYLESDPTSVVTLTFDGDVASANATLSFGSPEVEGDFYNETLTPVIEGNTIKVNLANVIRTPDTMVKSGTNYENMTLTISRVMDTTGQYAYSNTSGSVGAFAFTYSTLEVVTADVISEFTPASGAKLDDVATIEIWITDENKLQYDGVLFTFTNDNDETIEKVVDNSLITKEADPYDADAAILTVPVPTIPEGGWYVAVSLYNLASADGYDHSDEVYAEYLTGNAAIDNVFGDEVSEYTIYNTNGVLVLHTTSRDEVNNLPNGIYIINGKKFLINR